MPVKKVREPLDPELAARGFNNDRHRLVLAASVRAREIAVERRKKDPEDKIVYDHTPSGQALVEAAQGLYGMEYLAKLSQ